MSKKNFWTIVGSLLLAYLIISIIYPTSWTLSYFEDDNFVLGLDLQGGSRLVYQADLSSVSNQNQDSSLQGVREVIEKRINAFGVQEPQVQLKESGDKPQLIVELPGIKDLDEALERIGQTPVLKFKEQQDLTEEEVVAIEEKNQEIKQKAQTVLNEALQNPDDFDQLAKEHSDVESGQSGGDLGWFNPDNALPALKNPLKSMSEGEVYNELIKSQVGYHIIKKTGQKEDQLRASHIVFGINSTSSDRFVNTELTGEHLGTAQVTFQKTTGKPQIELIFNDEGATLFEEITARNVGKPIAIYLDGKSIIDTTGDGKITDRDLYAPQVQDKISGGKAVITGDLSLEKAKTIAQRLQSGALPVPIELISQKTIGPSLGAMSLDKSIKAGLIGLALIILFMILFYRLPGLVAGLSLVFFGGIVVALVKIFSITLTLAGIGGIILSIGMAVDANVLIFERLKEELRRRDNLAIAVKEGFLRAWPPIRDGNLTTLLIAVIMFYFGTSFIKGFAVTLSVGVIVSLFSALVLTRGWLTLLSETKLRKIKKLWS